MKGNFISGVRSAMRAVIPLPGFHASPVFAAPMSEVTRILSAIEQGDPHAAEQLLPLIYEELRKLAAQKLAQETPGQTLGDPRLSLLTALRKAWEGATRLFDHMLRAASVTGGNRPGRHGSRVARP
jgi:hypothetical protein